MKTSYSIHRPDGHRNNSIKMAQKDSEVNSSKIPSAFDEEEHLFWYLAKNGCHGVEIKPYHPILPAKFIPEKQIEQQMRLAWKSKKTSSSRH